jgi:hypothetical protein
MKFSDWPIIHFFCFQGPLADARGAIADTAAVWEEDARNPHGPPFLTNDINTAKNTHSLSFFLAVSEKRKSERRDITKGKGKYLFAHFNSLHREKDFGGGGALWSLAAFVVARR